MAKKAQILFLCAEGSVLALMAEGFTRYYGGTGIGVKSVVRGSKEVLPYCSWAMNETGIDIGDLELLSDSPGDLSAYTHFITLGKVEDGSPAGLPASVHQENWNLPNPAKVRGRPEEMILAFRSVRNQVEKKVKELLTKIFEK